MNEYIEKIIAYFNNQLSLEERNEVDNWVNHSLENKRFFEELKIYWENERKDDIDGILNTDFALQKVLDKISTINRTRKSISFKQVFKYAALVLVVLGLPIAGYFFYEKSLNEKLVYVSNIDQKKKAVLLADNSHIWLKQGSELNYKEGFAKKDRIINLKGEAYFDVTPNKNIPFIINIGKTSVEVVGTSFNLKDNGATIELFVNKGIVKFIDNETENNQVTVNIGEKAIFIKAQNKFIVSKSQNENYKAWITGKLDFKDIPLSDVCKQLSDYYDKKIYIKNSSDSLKKVNASYQNPPLEDVINTISFALNAEIVVEK